MCHGTPVFDLSYCLYSSANQEILNKLNVYLEIYYTSLSATLKAFSLNSESIYSFKTFKEEWKDCCKYGFPFGMFLWRLKLFPSDAAPDLTDKVIKMDKSIPSEDRQKLYEERIRELIIHLYDNDFL